MEKIFDPLKIGETLRQEKKEKEHEKKKPPFLQREPGEEARPVRGIKIIASNGARKKKEK